MVDFYDVFSGCCLDYLSSSYSKFWWGNHLLTLLLTQVPKKLEYFKKIFLSIWNILIKYYICVIRLHLRGRGTFTIYRKYGRFYEERQMLVPCVKPTCMRKQATYLMMPEFESCDRLASLDLYYWAGGLTILTIVQSGDSKISNSICK